MNTFSQHIPNFVDGVTPDTLEFETTEELLNSMTLSKYGQREDFSHFALNGNKLMEISDDGYCWWVVGYIEKPELVNLPKWEGGKYRAELSTGEVVVLSKEVVSSCGDELTLRDGTKARNVSR